VQTSASQVDELPTWEEIMEDLNDGTLDAVYRGPYRACRIALDRRIVDMIEAKSSDAGFEPEEECAAIIDVDVGRMAEDVLGGRATEKEVAETLKVPEKNAAVRLQHADHGGGKTGGSRTYTVILNRKIAVLIDYIARKNGDAAEEAYAWIIESGLRRKLHYGDE